MWEQRASEQQQAFYEWCLLELSSISALAEMLTAHMELFTPQGKMSPNSVLYSMRRSINQGRNAQVASKFEAEVIGL